jgi:hypothetical protein
MLAHSNRIFALAVAALMLFGTSTAIGQIGGGGGGVGGGGAGGGAGLLPEAGGVEIDANNVVTARTKVVDSDRLTRERLKNARVNVNKEIQEISELRKVSLVRLERHVAAMKAAGTPISDDVRYLAGLTRITHVFFYPEQNDIVIAGPAEGYFVNGENRVVGMKSGHATLHLEDLVAALRAFGPDGKRASLISCSIDPTQDGLKRLNETVREAKRRNMGPANVNQLAPAFIKALGHQVITIKGVSDETRFAQVMTEADYRMKLYGIGLEQIPVRGITSFIAKARPSNNGTTRWFFQPNYECVKVNEDRTAMELDGSGVKLVGEDESVDRDGARKGKGRASMASRAFCTTFTKNYSKLAAKATVFGELRNLIDMSIVAAYIQKSDMYAKAGWDMDTFGDEARFPIEIYPAPKKVAPVLNAVVKGGSLMTPIAGGVSIQPRVALNSDKVAVDKEGKIDSVRSSIDRDQLEADQWWWD